MIDIPASIAVVEAELRDRRRSLRSLLDLAEVRPSSWTRWRSGENSPTVAMWNRIQAALDQLRKLDDQASHAA